MEAIFYYLLKVNLVMAVTVLVFYLFLRREKFLQLNRLLLLMIAVISFVLPFLPQITYEVANTVNGSGRQQILPAAENLVPISAELPAVVSHTPIEWCMMIYVLIAAVFLIRLLAHIIRTAFIIHKTEKIKQDSLIFCSSADQGPFSFFRYIVIPNGTAGQQVILHERAHAKQWHSIDALFSEMIAALLWINPFIYLYKKMVRANLEFLADDDVLKKGADRKMYQLSLLRHVLKQNPVMAVNTFHSSGIRTRIGMMNTDHPSTKKAFRYFLMIPAIMIVYITVNPPRAVAAAVLPAIAMMESGKEISNAKTGETDLPAPNISGTRIITPAPAVHAQMKKAKIETPAGPVKTSVNIDARTDTVRISLRPVTEANGAKSFEGIYIIDGKEYHDHEIRELAATGVYEILLPARPAIAYYSPGDEQAIQRWGSKASKGVILIQPPTSTTP